MSSKPLQRQTPAIAQTVPDYEPAASSSAQRPASPSYPLTPPPDYEDLVRSDEERLRDSGAALEATVPRPTSGGAAMQPAVIPQVSTGFQNPFESPFVRAYPPALESRGIDSETFLEWLDAVNECFVANPVLSATQQIGNVIGLLHGAHGELAIAGAVIAGVSGASVWASSYFRTRAFIRESNNDLFHPLGLHATVLSTKKMCAAVDYPETKIRMLVRECGEDGNGSPSDANSPPTNTIASTSVRDHTSNGSTAVDLASLQQQTSQMKLSPAQAGSSGYPFPASPGSSSFQAHLQPSFSQSSLQPLYQPQLQGGTSPTVLPSEYQKYMSAEYHSQQQQEAAQKVPASPLPNIERAGQREWVMKRRMEALNPYVQPLSYSVTPADPSTQSNAVKWINEKSAARKTARQEKRMIKRHRESEKEFRKALKKTDEVRGELAAELAKMERELAKERRKADRKLAGHKAAKEEKERLKVEREFERERDKILREAAKEVREAEREIEKELKKGVKDFEKADRKDAKVANKIRWLVVREWTAEEREAELAKEAEGKRSPFAGWRRGGDRAGEEEEGDSEINDDVIA